MTGREKMEAAFSPEGTPEIPAVICYHGICLRDHWAEITEQPWWAPSAADSGRAFAVHADLLTKLGEDWFPLPLGPTTSEQQNIDVEEREDGVYRVDRASGTESELEEPLVGGWARDGRLQSHRPDSPPSSVQEVEERLPIGEEPDYQQPFRDGRAGLTQRVLDAFGQEKLPLLHVGTPLWGCHGIWGFEAMMTAVAETPELIECACDRLATRACRSVRQSAALGARAIWLEECMTDMVSPQHFARRHLPYLKRIVGEVRAQGLYSVYYYCGDPTGKLDLLIESGADALSFEESKKGFEIDVEEVVRVVDGRMAVLGNLDAINLLEHCSDEELRTEVARQIAAGRANGSRFIMSIGSPVTPGTPIDRVRRYTDLVHELGA